MFFNAFLLVVGVFTASTSVLMIRWSDEHLLLVAAYRLLIAGAILSPIFLRQVKKRGGWTLRDLRPTVLPGLILGLHFIAWIAGARLTPAANATLIVNMNPVAMPLFAFLLYREVLTPAEIAGTAVALAGVVLLGVADFRLSGATLAGDALCFVAMILSTVYLALARKNRNFAGGDRPGSIWLYVVPLYAVAGLFCFAVSLFFVDPIKPYTSRNMLNIAGLAVLPTVIGHTVYNHAMRKFRGQLVAIVNLGQFIFAGIMGYFWLGETPKPLFYVSSALVAGGACVAILLKGKRGAGTVDPEGGAIPGGDPPAVG
jgi:drug/metabolite transporter (DMT)-like permease